MVPYARWGGWGKIARSSPIPISHLHKRVSSSYSLINQQPALLRPKVKMPDNDPSAEIRASIQTELRHRGLSVTPQALNALVYTVLSSSREVIGDSDSLLLGLLQCGSYTLDILNDAGADTDHLMNDAAHTAGTYHSHFPDGDIDPIKTLFGDSGNFGRLLVRPELKTRPIEAADLLQEAISPKSEDKDYWSDVKGFDLENSHNKRTKLRVEEELHTVVGEALFDFCQILWINPKHIILRRTKPLSQAEINKLKKSFYYLDKQEVQCVARAIDRLIQKRELPLDDSAFVALAVEITSRSSIGSDHFVSGGGNYHDLSLSLNVSTRYAPERDQPILALVEEDGRIIARHFSYRGTGAINANNSSQVLSVSSPLILPLVPQIVLDEFEEILNSAKTHELDIQRFLERNPEILKSLGYTECRPQVILREPGKSDLRPDFLLHKPGNSGFDILDLKLPSAIIARQHPYPRMSHDITKAIGQLRAYRNYFLNPSNKDRFIREHGIEYFEPKLIVAIGRRLQYSDLSIREEIQQQSRDVRVMTYDELAAYAKTRTIKL